MPEGLFNSINKTGSVIPDEILDSYLAVDTDKECNDTYPCGDKYAPPSPLIDFPPTEQDIDNRKYQV